MNIVLLGSGNVASVLGRMLHKHRHNITEVYSRRTESADDLSAELEAQPKAYPARIDPETDIVLVALKDDALATASQLICKTDKVVVHTSGSVPMDILRDVSPNHGIFYPLQSLNKQASQSPEIPFLLEASNEGTAQLLAQLASSLNASYSFANTKRRGEYHLAAVFANNFANSLYTIAEKLCIENDLDFDLLKPLIVETAEKIKTRSPSSVQTGPAVRNDKLTIEKHLKMLKGDPGLEEIYKQLTRYIQGNINKDK